MKKLILGAFAFTLVASGAAANNGVLFRLPGGDPDFETPLEALARSKGQGRIRQGEKPMVDHRDRADGAFDYPNGQSGRTIFERLTREQPGPGNGR